MPAERCYKGSMLRTDRIGALFAGYRIDALIGHGGMGEVYRAENPRLGTWLALKLLAQDLADNEQFRERFVRESRAAASLDHPHVIPIFDADEWEGIPFIAMRYVEGSDLRAVMEEEGALDVDRTLELLGQMADALDWAHSKVLVHRDVKPANILIERRPRGKEHAYLSDFGVAKQALGRGLTSTGEFVGTIEYVAPEQIEGKTIDGRADVYALGCILFQCLAGAPPYDRDSTVGLMYAHLQEPPPLLSEKKPELPQAFDDVIRRALAKSPGDRYPTAGALISAAQAAAEGREVPRVAETVVRPKPVAQETIVRPSEAAPEEIAPTEAPPKKVEPTQAPPPVAQTPPTARAGETILSRPRGDDGPRVRRSLLIAAALLGVAALAAGGAYALMGGSGGKTSTPSTGVNPGITPPPPRPPPPPPPPPPAPPRCRIGNVKGLTFAAARRRLRAGNCSIGTVSRAYSATVPSNRVSGQNPGPGISLKNRGNVGLVISRGPRPAPPRPPPPPPPPPPPSPPGPCPANRCPKPPPSPPKCPGGRCPGG
jgi:serine/threonine protein kinase